MAPAFGTASISPFRGREKFRVIIPLHPGFGDEDDDPAMNEMHDYVMHYLDLFDALGLDKFHLVGFSLGGLLAANLRSSTAIACTAWCWSARPACAARSGPKAIFHCCRRKRSRRCWSPTSTSSSHSCRKIPKTSISWATAIAKAATLARLLWEHPYDTKLPRYLHRLTMPTLLVWGEDDKLLSVQTAELLAPASFPRRNCKPSRAPVIWSSTKNARRSTRCSAFCPIAPAVGQRSRTRVALFAAPGLEYCSGHRHILMTLLCRCPGSRFSRRIDCCFCRFRLLVFASSAR